MDARFSGRAGGWRWRAPGSGISSSVPRWPTILPSSARFPKPGSLWRSCPGVSPGAPGWGGAVVSQCLWRQIGSRCYPVQVGPGLALASFGAVAAFQAAQFLPPRLSPPPSGGGGPCVGRWSPGPLAELPLMQFAQPTAMLPPTLPFLRAAPKSLNAPQCGVPSRGGPLFYHMQ